MDLRATRRPSGVSFALLGALLLAACSGSEASRPYTDFVIGVGNETFEGLIVRAKAWARKRGVSLSRAVATLFEQLPAAPDSALSPWTQKLVGMAVRGRRRRPLSDEAIRRAHLDHLEEKHR